MAKPLQLARLMVRDGAGLNPDQAGAKLLEEGQNLPALQLSAKNHFTLCINTVDLEDGLGDTWKLVIFAPYKLPRVGLWPRRF